MQPDGSKLTQASLIRPGWTLRMPGDAFGPGIRRSRSSGRHAPGRPGRLGRARLSGIHRAVTADGHRRRRPTARGHGDHPRQQAAAAWPYELSAASLLAAGVLAALGRRRRQRLWQRGFGRRLVPPTGDAAVAETALRLGADDPAVQLLDLSLRQLSAALAVQGKRPPTVFAAHLDHDHLDLWVAPRRPGAPARRGSRPTAARSGGCRPRPGSRGRPSTAAILAPYPGLVTLGMNESGRIMVDLEVAHGLIALRGPQDTVRAALAALAVELVTNRWSDRMRVTLVGLGDGLELIAPDRVTIARNLDEALPELERRGADLDGQLSAWGIDSVLTGRSVTSNTDAWAPHYLITAVPPTPEQTERLLAAARTRHRTALGFVVAGDVAGASWTWDLTAEGRLHAGVLGFEVAAQLLPAAQYAAVVSLFRAGDGNAPLTPPAAGELRPPTSTRGARRGRGRAARAGRGQRARAGRARAARAGDRAGRLPGGPPGRRAPERAGRGAVAARDDGRGTGRGRGPGPPLARDRPRRPAQPGHRPRRPAAAGPRRTGRLAGLPGAGRAGGPCDGRRPQPPPTAAAAAATWPRP